MSSTPWGSGPDNRDGVPDASGGSPSPDYAGYDSGSSAPSYGSGAPSYDAGQSGAYGSGQPYPAQGTYPQQGAYPQQSAYAQQGAYQGYPGGPPQGPPPSRTGPIVALIIGLLLMLGGPIIGLVVGAAQGISGVAGSIEEYQMISNPGAVDLPANAERLIVESGVTEGSVDAETTELPLMTCTVTDPGGSPVSVTPMSPDFSDGSSVLGPTFTTTDAGTYSIECSTASTELSVTPPIEIGNVAQAGMSVMLGFFAGFVGLVVTIVAIVMLVRANGKRRRMGY